MRTSALVAELANFRDPADLRSAGLGSLTKVLALLRPQLVPMMPDAAIYWAIGRGVSPTEADQDTTPSDAFAPMLDWFADNTRANERQLVALAAAHSKATLDAPQVLDRLVWFESWGYRYAK